MSIDRRELILARLIEVAGSLPGIITTERNNPKISAHRRPAIVIFDSDETGTQGEFHLGRPSQVQGIFAMTPEVWIMAGGPAASVGSDLNALRMLLLRAVLSDSMLKELHGPMGGIQYQGCATELARGRTLEGEMHLTFDVHYSLLTDELM